MVLKLIFKYLANKNVLIFKNVLFNTKIDSYCLKNNLKKAKINLEQTA